MGIISTSERLFSVASACGRFSALLRLNKSKMVRGNQDATCQDGEQSMQNLHEELRRCRKAVEDFAASMRTLTATNSELVAQNMHLQCENSQLRETLSRAQNEQSVRIREEDIAQKCYDVFKEAAQKEEKRENVVLLGVPEGATDEETLKQDLQLAENLVKQCGLLPTEIVKAYRHGTKSGSRPRTLKVKFCNKSTPAHILSSMREKVMYDLLPSRSRIRRDLTMKEQIQEREARREAYRRNSDAQLFKWTVNRDLQLVELKNPRSWQPTPASIDPGSDRTLPANSNVTMRKTELHQDSGEKICRTLLIFYMNVRSLTLEKFVELKDFILERKPSIFNISETWFTESTPLYLFKIDGYVMISSNRNGKRGGGLVMWIKGDLKYRKLDYDVIAADSTYEQLVVKIESFIIVTFYNPPNSRISLLENQWDRLLFNECSCRVCPVFIGDANSDVTDGPLKKLYVYQELEKLPARAVAFTTND